MSRIVSRGSTKISYTSSSVWSSVSAASDNSVKAELTALLSNE